MAKVGEIVFEVDADTAKFTRGLGEATGQMSKFGSDLKNLSADVAAFGAAFAVAGAAVVASSIKSSRELQNFVNVSNTTLSEFQALSMSAARFGVDQEKLSDILKDTNDKMGDFLRTGQGELADFFEQIAPKVGVTADQFRGLSGPQALQLYVKSLQAANLSQKEMTFFMESIANDGTALIPMFINSADAIGEAEKKMADLNIAISELELNQLVAARDSFSDVEFIVSNLAKKFSADLSPFVLEATERFKQLTKETNGFQGVASSVAEKAIIGLGKIIDFGRFVQKTYLGIKFVATSVGLGVVSLTEMTVAAIRTLQNTAIGGINATIEGLNNLPGVDIDLVPLVRAGAMERGLQSTAREMELSLIGTAERIQEINNMDSAESRVLEFLDAVKARSMAAATEVSNLNKGLKDTEGGGEEEEEDSEPPRSGFDFEAKSEEAARQRRLEAEKSFQEQMAQVRQHGATAITDLVKSSNGVQAGAYSDAFASILSSSASFSKKAFEINKSLSVANALVKGREAVVGAYAFGANIGGPALGAAFGAAAGAATLAQIKSIQSQQFGGGGSVGGISSGSTPAASETAGAAQAPQAERVVNVSIQGEVFSKESVVKLLNEAVSDGYSLNLV